MEGSRGRRPKTLLWKTQSKCGRHGRCVTVFRSLMRHQKNELKVTQDSCLLSCLKSSSTQDAKQWDASI